MRAAPHIGGAGNAGDAGKAPATINTYLSSAQRVALEASDDETQIDTG